ncbi:MAG: glycosyltransferase [Candidatus Hydrogenedentota bacterium]
MPYDVIFRTGYFAILLGLIDELKNRDYYVIETSERIISSYKDRIIKIPDFSLCSIKNLKNILPDYPTRLFILCNSPYIYHYLPMYFKARLLSPENIFFILPSGTEIKATLSGIIKAIYYYCKDILADMYQAALFRYTGNPFYNVRVRERKIKFSDKKKVLFISYFFPPQASSGSFRPAKFVKYLKRSGWDVSVITTDTKHYLMYPPDATMLKGVEDVEIFRVSHRDSVAEMIDFLKPDGLRLFLKKYFQPDTAVLWSKKTFHKAVKIIEDKNIPLVWLTGNPFSLFYIGKYLKLVYPDIKVVFDYRDLWSLTAFQFYDTESLKTNFNIEKELIKYADHITIVPASVIELSKTFNYPIENITEIPNGYDEEDFAAKTDYGLKLYSGMKLGYIGSAYQDYSPAKVIEVVDRLNRREKTDIKIYLVGYSLEHCLRVVAPEIINNSCIIISHMEYLKTLSFMVDMDMLLLCIPENAPYNYSGKLFNYIRANRPILLIAPPDSAPQRVLQTVGSGDYISGWDEEEIAMNLRKCYERYLNGQLVCYHDRERFIKYSREEQTKMLNKIFSSLITFNN